MEMPIYINDLQTKLKLLKKLLKKNRYFDLSAIWNFYKKKLFHKKRIFSLKEFFEIFKILIKKRMFSPQYWFHPPFSIFELENIFFYFFPCQSP
jgi:hypothetical protein